ncbi:MAG: peptidylprolyl isomerase [Deltaproteobacteria bacterium]|nr:peptidylprolyl isomerase [Deltaproteobacteria bacterium]
MKLVWKVLCLGMAILLWAVPGQAEIVDRIVAVVNEDVITLSEMNDAFDPYRQRIVSTVQEKDREKILDEARATMLGKMIDNLLIEQEARKAGIIVKDDEVMEVINNIMDRRNLTMKDLAALAEKEGMTLDAYRKEMKIQIARSRLVMREIKSKITVSEEEIGEYYRRNLLNYEGKEAVRIKQILITSPETLDEKARKRRLSETEAIRQRLLGGEPFEVLAATYSQGPAASSGGDLGFIDKGSMLPEVEAMAYKLARGEISPIIESSIGFHIIKVVDKRGAGVKPIASVREEIKAKIENEKMEKKYDEWIEELRKKSHIEIKSDVAEPSEG